MGHVKNRLDVDGEHAVELGFGDIEHRLVAMGPAGVVHHDVEPAVGRDHVLDPRGDIARGGDVALDRPRVRSDRGCNLLRARTVEIQDRDLGAFTCEGPRNPGPKPEAPPVTSAICPQDAWHAPSRCRAQRRQLDTDAAMSQAAPLFRAGAALCLRGGRPARVAGREPGGAKRNHPTRRLRRRPSPCGEGKHASRPAEINTWRRYEICGRPAVTAVRRSSAHHR